MKIIPTNIEPKTAEYIINHTASDDDYLKKIINEMEKNGIRKINITPFEGNIISTILSAIKPKRGVEIGTLCGYSSLWISKALDENGKLYTIEKEPKHAEIALKMISELGVEKKIIVMNSDAKEALTKLSKFSPFDFCFIDANKDDYPYYIKWALKNLRSGGLIIAHNPLMKGNLFYEGEDKEQNAKSRGMREFLHILFTDDKISQRAIIPTSDGIAVGVVK
jgi:predicted O-methyltransferase YrrM